MAMPLLHHENGSHDPYARNRLTMGKSSRSLLELFLGWVMLQSSPVSITEIPDAASDYSMQNHRRSVTSLTIYRMYRDGRNLYGIIVIHKLDIAWSLLVAFDKLLVSGRTLILRIAGEHALYTHAHALGTLDRTPSLCA
jgi:hypothetical protein